jgi:cyclopropane-fatty-acyl-phospholipid synthase
MGLRKNTTMLYKFKSQAAADVLMLQPRAEEILKIIGKHPGPTGIITVAQAAPAIAALQAEIRRREALKTTPPPERDDDYDASNAQADAVTLRARAMPFIQLLEISSAAGKDVVWGV